MMSEITTYGWDVVYAMQYNMINKSIQANHSYPKQFLAKIKIVGNLYIISGSWANWALKNGGSGKMFGWNVLYQWAVYLTNIMKLFTISQILV
ncbi:TULIP family P47-like protein [Arsenophonus endosymbiont of Aleurodicus floccissimus]|uniref:TULIP family P47-like protein n=1 Tax=Arsenophonus endosymbiont of Aleurodicus floccissimus TaxID=2152761 RepID=UPI000E6B2E49|nr:TULIP family P47-like protein [Arsenophonus endosymbiont of Aleurodicus floccissimus]